MIKTILFDLGGVLFTNGTKKFIADLSQRYNLDQSLVTDVIEGDLGTQYRESIITRDEFWKHVLESLRIDADANLLAKDWIGGYEIITGTRDIIEELKSKYKVYFLSDNVKERAEELDKIHHYLEWFDGGIFSHEVGVRKPNPKIYQYALDKAQVKPEEAVFIDDKPSALVPAKEMGIQTILFSSPEDLRAQLKMIKVI